MELFWLEEDIFGLVVSSIIWINVWLISHIDSYGCVMSVWLIRSQPPLCLCSSAVQLAVEETQKGAFYNQGQCCTAASRVFVEDSIYQEFVQRSIEEAKKIVIGDPLDPQTSHGPQVGPTVSLWGRSRSGQVVTGCVSSDRQRTVRKDPGSDWQRDQGGSQAGVWRSISSRPGSLHPTHHLLRGRGPHAHRQGGGDDTAHTIPTPPDVPTLIHWLNLCSLWLSMCGQIFGPVQCIFSFSSQQEVVDRANSLQYGLVSAVFTKNMDRALSVSAALETGTVW